MKAAVMTQFREPVEIQEVADPIPGPHDALIEVKGCGVCRSDWHAWQEDLSWVGVKIDLPHVLGHEISGVVREGGADVSVYALGMSQTALPAVGSLSRGGRHLQIGLTSKEDQGKIAFPVDAMVLQEISFIGTFGCPMTSYPGLLTLVANGKLNPQSLVTGTIPIENVNNVLSAMTDFATTGFQVIDTW